MTPQDHLDLSILSAINADIACQYEEMGYRPEVVIILKNENGKVLLVQSSQNDSWWGFPQGGIDQGEDVLSATGRELEEETGIGKDEFRIVGYCGSNQINIPNWERDGFRRGKKYYYFLALCRQVDVRLQREELSNYEWLDPEAVTSRLSTVNPEKRKTLLEALASAQD